MDHEHLQDEPTTRSGRDRRSYDDDRVQRSGATIFFWILLGLLIALGICVLVSIILALLFGS